MELWQIKAILNDLGVEPDLASQIMASARRQSATMNPSDMGTDTLYTDPIAHRESVISAVVGHDTLDNDESDKHSTESNLILGQYEDLGELGKGSMGTVRLVYDRKFNRRLAMKIIHPNLRLNDSAASRFVEEARVCAQLQHPNIVPVHDFGVLPDGRFFFHNEGN